MTNKYVSVKQIEGVNYIAIGKPHAMMDVLFTLSEIKDMQIELQKTLSPNIFAHPDQMTLIESEK